MKRPRINDRQCRLVLNDLIEFGYASLTFEHVRKVADQIADDTYSKADPIALIIIGQIDEAIDMRRRNGRGELPMEIKD